MTPRPLNPRKAWLIGYRISYETWCQWVPTLPIPEECLLPPGQDLDGIRIHSVYWSYYLEWKIHTSEVSPGEVADNSMRVSSSAPHCFLKNLCSHFSEDEWLQDDTASGAFIPLRWFEYTHRDETNPNDPDYNATVFQERETDRAQLQNLLKFFQKQGAPLDKDKISFGCMVDIHPHDEWTAY